MTRATSFGAVADDYDRLRPAPPAAVLDWIVPAGAATAVDLGAGTGLMTRALEPRVGEVVAVEPDERMLAVLRRRSPGVRALVGRADAIPLPDAAVDLVVVSSAWHWMDPATAVPEIARVLRDGGRFAVVWTGRDTSAPLMAELIRAVVPADDAEREERARRFRSLDLPPGSPFGPVDATLEPFEVELSVDDAAESFGTYSGVITLGEEGRAEAIERGRRHLADRFGAAARLAVPMRSRAFRTTRLPCQADRPGGGCDVR